MIRSLDTSSRAERPKSTLQSGTVAFLKPESVHADRGFESHPLRSRHSRARIA
jgi:hypothetical protein